MKKLLSVLAAFIAIGVVAIGIMLLVFPEPTEPMQPWNRGTNGKYDPLPGIVSYRTMMFYRAGDWKCESDWRKICWSGNDDRVTPLEVSVYPNLARRYEVTSVPTYIIEKRCRDTETVVFRSHSLYELDRFTRGRR